jgi:putative ABC transport system ATP-binding protein
MNSASLMVELEGVSKSFDHPSGAITVLRELSLSIVSGQSCSILGPSGSGKSTLLALLSGLERPNSGSIVMDGIALHTMTEKALSAFRSKSLGIVFQQFHLIPHLTALENVILPLDIAGHSKVNAKAMQALEDVELMHRVKHFPSELSGGECQRVAIARAMVTNPKILLADEPSGNLDKATGEHVMATLFKRVQHAGTTMILVTHNEMLAQACDQQVMMESGQLLPLSSRSKILLPT